MVDDFDDDSWAEDDEASTVACPNCHREVYEDAPQCPYCGQYITEEDVSTPTKPWWIILGVMLCLLAALLWVGF